MKAGRMKSAKVVRYGAVGVVFVGMGLVSLSLRSDPVFFAGEAPPIAQKPLYVDEAVPPLNMLVMGKDHKIYYEAYNDASDLDGDGILDVGYRGWELKADPSPDESRYKIDYYGYFNSYACYTWNTGDGGRFVAASDAPNKTCGRRGGEWSGDFLNYATTSRMDALRRVLYGGWRQTDTASQTILQGAFFPQDAHSWGKEYQSVARDGYDINLYTPLPLPNAGRYHLFAVTTTTGSSNSFLFPGYQAPLFRVLRQSPFRVWNWLSIEGPVANNDCFNAANQRVSCTSGGTTARPAHPANRAEFDLLEQNFAVPANFLGSRSNREEIECTSNCNPHSSNPDVNYMTIIEGTIEIDDDGRYRFWAEGDDAVDFELRNRRGDIVAQGGCYGAGGFGTCINGDGRTPPVTLSEGDYTFRFRHEQGTGGDGYRLLFTECGGGNSACDRNRNSYSLVEDDDDVELKNNVVRTYNLTQATGAATRDADRLVRVETCGTNADLHDSSCKVYPGGGAKPTGILHEYGESQRMYFGLITGSQRNNLEGGVLRRNMSNFASEIDADTGVFLTNVDGIARSIDRLRMIGGAYANGTTDNISSNSNWAWGGGGTNCPSIGNRPIANGECQMWGNPIAEMLYESMRYYAGAAAPTPRFVTGGSTQGNEDATLGLPTPEWRDPYASGDNGLNYPACSRPYQTIISDINPSYDGDLPGSAFAGATTTTGATPASILGFSAGDEGQAIWTAEFGGARNVFIGESGAANDGNPTVKSASSFGDIRGLSPEEPGKMGTYYTASVARFGRNAVNINAAADDQSLSTYSIALASPLPQIEFPTTGGNTVKLVPFAKTVSGTFGESARKPTNTIVDFYVEEYANFPQQEPKNTTINQGRPRAVFRINYEDVEQGNDHDMDAIVRYEIVANANNTVTVTLASEYASGGANQNMGYVISGTTRDGVYLEVRDRDNGDQASSAYILNTPSENQIRWAGECVNQMSSSPCNEGLTFNSTRTFSPSANPPATQLRDPLWYAAKYGSPNPANWDTSAPGTPGHGDPDNYFLVTNPLNLRNQLRKAFDDIASRNVEAGSSTLSGARVGAESFTLQPAFRRDRNGKDWSGNLSASAINPDGSIGALLWSAAAQLPAPDQRRIYTLTAPGPGTNSVPADARVSFRTPNLGSTAADQLGAIGVFQPDIDNGHYGSYRDYTPEDFVAYVRGDQSREASVDGASNTLRIREFGVIGSIVNSEPVVASPRADLGYGMHADSMFSGYIRNGATPGYLDLKAGRDAMAYVGSNGGMLHGFSAGTIPCPANPQLRCPAPDAGRERFAYVPNAVLTNLGQLAKTDEFYEHRYYVDGQISVGDVKIGTGGASDWRTLLVGSTGGGARSVFALDVSDPSNLNETSIRWERNSAVDNDIGHVYGKPLIVPLENGSWGVLFGNGYGGNLSDPSLYILDAYTGEVIRKLTADDGNPGAAAASPVTDWLCQIGRGFEIVSNLCARRVAPYNGLGQITAIDKSGNGKVDTVYGGDLQGNLWKFDLSAVSASGWGVANAGLPLFTAETAGGERQPITGGMRVTAGPGVGVMVYFGTGRYLFDRGAEPGDDVVPANPTVQSLYAVFDNGSAISGGRSALQAQTITGTGAGPDGVVIRSISRTRVAYSGDNARRGWYLDLQVNLGTAEEPDYRPLGERFIATPRIQSGRVFFTTFTPSEDSCKPGGENFAYGLDLLSGSGALANVQVLPSQEAACTGADCGAISIDSAAPVTSNSVAAIAQETFAESSGVCDPTTENCPTFEQCQVVIYPGAFVLPRPCGRQSWRQIK